MKYMKKHTMDAELNTSEKCNTPWTSIYITGACAFMQSAQFSIFFSSMWPYLKKLDPQAEETLFGTIVALYSLGQCISAPTFGYWSNRIEQVRLPLLVGFCVMFLGNFIYLFLQYISRSWVGYVMMIARFISGSGTGNMSLLRAYASTASTSSDRSRAISCVSGGIAVGTMIGPAFQLLFTPLGEDGVSILSLYNLNIYNAPALFSLILSILGFLTVKFKFEEEYRALHKAATGVSTALADPDYFAVGVCILTRFTQIFVQTTIETIGSAYSMMMFSFNKEEAVIYNALIHLIAGIIGAILYSLFIAFDFTKYIRPRLSNILALFSFIVLFLATYSWPFLPGEVELLVNGSDTGCDSARFDWCHGLTAVSSWIYYSCYIVVFGFSFSIMNIALSTLFSKIIGPRRQGTIQGIFQMSGSSGRMMAPLIISGLYSLSGPRIAWILELTEVSATIFLWIIFFRRMVPFEGLNKLNKNLGGK